MLVGMPGAPATDETELGWRMTNFVTTVRHDTDEIYVRLYVALDDRVLMKTESRLSHEAWVQSMDASDIARVEVASLRIICSCDLKKMAPKRTTRSTPATTNTTTTTMTDAQLKALIDQDVANALAARDADRSQNLKTYPDGY
nr:hypothetical protein [Tanacetum cinerariifolium]